LSKAELKLLLVTQKAAMAIEEHTAMDRKGLPILGRLFPISEKQEIRKAATC